MGFSRQEYWSGLPFPSPGDLPDPGIEPVSPALAGGFFTTELPRKLSEAYKAGENWELRPLSLSDLGKACPPQSWPGGRAAMRASDGVGLITRGLIQKAPCSPSGCLGSAGPLGFEHPLAGLPPWPDVICHLFEGQA